MIVTARYLDDLHRQSGSNGHLTLPYRARLTPLASDFVKSRKIVLGYSDVGNGSAPAKGGAESASALPGAGSQSAAMLWWCDGPCGAAKAAVTSFEKESSILSLDRPADPKQLIPVLKTIAEQVKSSRAPGAVLLVQNGAMATVCANRCPSLRAVLGTSLDAVEAGVRQVAANVLIIEYPRQTLQQVKNLLSRFVRGARQLSPELEQQLKELASCG